MMRENGVIVRSSVKTALAEPERILAPIALQKHVPEIHACSETPFQKEVLKLGKEGLRSLCRSQQKHFGLCAIDVALARHRKNTVTASTIFSVFPSTLSITKDDDALTAQSINLRLVQKLIASEWFFRLSQGRPDTALVTKRLFKARNQIIKGDIVVGSQKVLQIIKLNEVFTSPTN